MSHLSLPDANVCRFAFCDSIASNSQVYVYSSFRFDFKVCDRSDQASPPNDIDLSLLSRRLRTSSSCIASPISVTSTSAMLSCLRPNCTRITPIPTLFLSSFQSSFIRQAHTYARQDRGLYNGTHVQFGSSISDSHRKSPRIWLPNVHAHSLYSKSLRRTIKLRITASVWRTIQQKYDGELDGFLTSASKEIQRNLGARGEGLRDEVLSARRKQAANVLATATASSLARKAKRTVIEQKVEESAKLEGLATGM